MKPSLRSLLSETEIETELFTRPGWVVKDNKLLRRFVFNDFGSAVGFISGLVEPADQLNHHPDIRIVYNQVTVTLFTHDLHGLTQLDFLLADRISHLFEQRERESS